jgi:carbamate kinase
VWRRVVASPAPQRVVEIDTAADLLRRGVTVVLAGGGGIPVVDGEQGLEGVEAVVDKDLVGALVAEQLAADLFLVLTDVPAVMDGYGTPAERALRDVAVSDLAQLHFPPGSMGPKVQAVCEFVQATGARAAIGSLDELIAVFDGTAGTQVRLQV